MGVSVRGREKERERRRVETGQGRERISFLFLGLARSSAPPDSLGQGHLFRATALVYTFWSLAFLRN